MVTSLRRFARSWSLVALVVLLAPPAAADCQALSLSSHGTMRCCLEAEAGAALGSDCCSVREQQPQPEQSSTPAGSRRLDNGSSLDATVLSNLSHGAPVEAATSPLPCWRPHAPPGPLYLRLSAIRR